MGDVGETYRAWGEVKHEKKQKNKTSSTQILTDKGVDFEVKNDGFHLVVKHDNSIVDFWPSTGKWIIRNGINRGRGIFNMLRHLGVDKGDT